MRFARYLFAASLLGSAGVAQAQGTKTTPASVDAQEDQQMAPTTATPATASPVMVRCRDGSMEEVRAGACETRGGVDDGTAAAPQAAAGTAPVARTALPARAHNPKSELTPDPPLATPQSTPTALCKDGSLARPMQHSDTCAGHAGFDTWVSGTGTY
jgi:hypothetical protein